MIKRKPHDFHEKLLLYSFIPALRAQRERERQCEFSLAGALTCVSDALVLCSLPVASP